MPADATVIAARRGFSALDFNPLDFHDWHRTCRGSKILIRDVERIARQFSDLDFARRGC